MEYIQSICQQLIGMHQMNSVFFAVRGNDLGTATP